MYHKAEKPAVQPSLARAHKLTHAHTQAQPLPLGLPGVALLITSNVHCHTHTSVPIGQAGCCMGNRLLFLPIN